MSTKVSKNLITSVDPSQITAAGATDGQVLTFDGTTSKWTARSIIDAAFTSNQLLSSNGYQVFPGGFIVQWGSFTSNSSNTQGSPQIVQLPISFPNNILFAIPAADGGYSGSVEIASMDWSTANKTTKTQLGIYSNYTGICKYVAIGY